jgi:PKD repeat protein
LRNETLLTATTEHFASNFVTDFERQIALSPAPQPRGPRQVDRTGAAPRPSVIRMKLVGASSDAEIIPEDPLPGRFNYLQGNDRTKWVIGVEGYARIRQREVYPGVDLIFHGRGGRLEHDFQLSPGADPRRIEIEFDGIDDLSISPVGDLLLAGKTGSFVFRRPVGYQQARLGRNEVPVRYVRLGAHRVGFHVAGADPREALVIDPVVEYSTFLGGSFLDGATSVAADALGNTYVTGFTQSWDFPLRSSGGCVAVPSWANFACDDAFVTKLDPAGRLVYSTFIGGSRWEEPRGIAVTPSGEVLVTGATDSPEFPVTAQFGSTAPKRGAPAEGVPVASAFVTKLSASGAGIVYSTVLRGTGDDEVSGLAVDSGGNAWIAGTTDSPDFPAVAAEQATRRGQISAFVAKLDPGGSRLVFSTYLGGSTQDLGTAVAVDPAGNGYAVGVTTSPDFPLLNAYQTNPGGAFLTKFDGSGAIVYSTYLGGRFDRALGVTVDPLGGACVVGATVSPDFPSLHPIQPTLRGRGDAFVTKFTPSGNALVFSTVFGGSGPDAAFAVATAASGDIVVAGLTGSADFPTVNDWGAAKGGTEDMFLAKIPPTGGGLAFAGYAGGDSSGLYSPLAAAQWLLGVAVDPSGNVYLAGNTSSADTPVVSAVQPRYGGGLADALVLKLHDDATAGYTVAATAAPMSTLVGLPISFTSAVVGGTAPYTFGWDFGDGSPRAAAASPGHTYGGAGDYTVKLAVTDAASHTAWTAIVVDVAAQPCTLVCAASVPLAAAAAQPVAFSASASQLSCTGNVGYTWTFGDGASSTDQNPSHTYPSPGLYSWSLQANVGSVTCNRSGTITVAAAPVNAVYLIPALAHKPGYYGSRWRADLTVVNPNDAAANLTLAYFSESAPVLRTAALPGQTTVEWDDILVSLFGFPQSGSTSGVVQVISDVPVAGIGRSYNVSEGGTFGGTFPALTTADGLGTGKIGLLPQLKRNASYRSNVGFVNLGTFTCTIRLRLLDHGGLKLGERTMDVAAGRWTQLDDVFGKLGAGNADLAYGTVEVLTQGGTAWAYAAVIDNATGDPTTVPVIVP